jgi:hypothetical protein
VDKGTLGSMATLIWILAVIVVGAACLGIGYLLGNKKKVIAQVQNEIAGVKTAIKDRL